MKSFSIVLVLIVMLHAGLSVASGGQDSCLGRFNGFKRLLSDSETIAIVRFEKNSTSVFRVVEMLYPEQSYRGEYFAEFGERTYGMLSPDYNPEPSYPVVAGEEYLVFLSRLDGPQRRVLNPYGGFVMPSYACAYRFSDNCHAAVPLFDLNRQSDAARLREQLQTWMTEAYGTIETSEIVSATRAVVEVAAKGRRYSASKDKTSGENKVFHRILAEVAADGALDPDVLRVRVKRTGKRSEPPARAQDFSSLRNSRLNQVRIPAFTIKDAGFADAIDVLEQSVRKRPGFEKVRFIIARELKDEGSSHNTLFNIDVRNLPASSLLELLSAGMHVTAQDEDTFVIERL